MTYRRTKLWIAAALSLLLGSAVEAALRAGRPEPKASYRDGTPQSALLDPAPRIKAPVEVAPPVPEPANIAAPAAERSRSLIPVKPVAPATPAPPAVKRAASFHAAPRPVASDADWKIIIRPQVYKASDPEEYMRTGRVVWQTPIAPLPHSANEKSSTAAAPGDAGPAMQSGSRAPLAAASGIPCGPWSYQAAYDSIPFNRAEYEANPSYRHDAAMELLFGTLRPTSIVRMNHPYFSRYPDLFRYRHSVYPYPTPGSHAIDINHSWNFAPSW